MTPADPPAARAPGAPGGECRHVFLHTYQHDKVLDDWHCDRCGLPLAEYQARLRSATPIPPDDEDTRRWVALTDRVIELEQQLRTVTAYYHATHVLPECVSWQDCQSEPCRTVRPLLGVKHEH